MKHRAQGRINLQDRRDNVMNNKEPSKRLSFLSSAFTSYATQAGLLEESENRKIQVAGGIPIMAKLRDFELGHWGLIRV